jgi:Tfp pilus assembly protein PilF
LNPSAAAAQLELARLRLARGDAAAALTAAEAAVADRPDDADAAVVLARSLRARGDLDRARRELASALNRKLPAEAALSVELGWVELAAKRSEPARTAFERGLSAAPGSEEARSGAIAGDLAAGDLKKARARVEQWLAANPADVSAQVLAARVDLADNAVATAEARLRAVITATPGRLDAYELLAAHYVKQGRSAAALESYRALAARVPDDPGPATMVGILLESGNDRTGARAQYEAVLARAPRAGVAANNLAWLLAEDGRYDEAMRWAQVAVEVLRGRPEPSDTLGVVLLKLNRPTEALAAFEKAVTLAPHNQVYQEHRATAKAALAR